MILLNFVKADRTCLGVKTAAGVIDIAAAAADLDSANSQIPTSIEALINDGQAAQTALTGLVAAAARHQAAAWLLNEAELKLSYPVPDGTKILCVGLNYRRHAEESGMAIPKTPVLFSKFSNTLAASGETIPLPSNAADYDYEVELAVVIGKRAKYVGEADALDYVFGYCTANDVSERTLQFLTGQWLLGKTLDKFFPVGPYLVTADEVGDPQTLQLQTWVNGELRQNSNTADMIFTVAQIVSYVSQYLTLEAGDVISTGTPEGVIHGMENKVWLKPGDEVSVEVEKLGKLTNAMSS